MEEPYEIAQGVIDDANQRVKKAEELHKNFIDSKFQGKEKVEK